MKKVLLPVLLVIGSISSLTAQLYVPTGSIPTNTNGSSNVGVGVINPAYPLDVLNQVRIQGTDPKLFLARTNDNFFPSLYSYATSFANDHFSFAINDMGAGVYPTPTFSSTRIHLNTSASSTGTSMLFETRPPSGSFTTKMVLTTDGNLGIGTTDARTQLVVGDGFGALVSGSSGGYGVFGSNLATVQSTSDLATPYTHTTFGFAGMRTSWGKVEFFTSPGATIAGATVSPSTRMIIDAQGNVGIGTTAPGSFKLAVEGKIGAREVNITAATPWPDYVFVNDYKLPSLETVRSFIGKNHRLPEMPSAAEVSEEGVDVGNMNVLLVKKIEELTLYMIDLKDENEAMKKEMTEIKKKLADLGRNR